MDYLGIYLILIWVDHLGITIQSVRIPIIYYFFMVDYLGVTIQSVRIPIIYYLILFRVNYLGGVDVPWTCQWINAVAMAETFMDEFI